MQGSVRQVKCTHAMLHRRTVADSSSGESLHAQGSVWQKKYACVLLSVCDVISSDSGASLLAHASLTVKGEARMCVVV